MTPTQKRYEAISRVLHRLAQEAEFTALQVENQHSQTLAPAWFEMRSLLSQYESLIEVGDEKASPC